MRPEESYNGYNCKDELVCYYLAFLEKLQSYSSISIHFYYRISDKVSKKILWWTLIEKGVPIMYIYMIKVMIQWSSGELQNFLQLNK